MDDRAARHPADHAVPRVAVPAAGAHRGEEGHPPGRAADPEDQDGRVRACRSCSSSCSSIALIAERVGRAQLTLAMLTILIMVSLVPLTGWSKQISLAQITFVGAGAFAYLQWAPDLGSIGGMIVAALFAIPFGVAMALPGAAAPGSLPRAGVDGVRADGRDPVLPATRDPRVRRQADPARSSILGFDFSQPFDFLGIHFGQDVGTLFFITAALGVVGVLVVWLHKSRVRPPAHRAGRQPRGVRDARHQPDRHQARRVRDLGGHRRVRRRAARHLPGHRHRAGLRDARRPRLPAAARGGRRRGRERRGVRWVQPASSSR